MHLVGGRRSVEDVIVAEDFTFAASSVMGDDVTGLGFPMCDAADALTFSSVDAFTFSSLGHVPAELFVMRGFGWPQKRLSPTPLRERRLAWCALYRSRNFSFSESSLHRPAC
jgi:hypothetical protein